LASFPFQCHAELHVLLLQALEKHGILLQYFNETAHLKLAAVKSYVCDLLESDSKFLLFAHHRTMLNGLQGMLDEKVACAFFSLSVNMLFLIGCVNTAFNPFLVSSAL